MYRIRYDKSERTSIMVKYKCCKVMSDSQLSMSNKAQEQRYQAFVHNSHEGIWRVEVDIPIPISLPAEEQVKLMYERGYMAEANNAMAAMYGLNSVSALIGMRLPDLLIESDPNNTEYLKAFVASGYSLSDVESHEVDQDGNIKIFKNSLIGVVEDGALVRAWGTQQDVTANKRADQLRAENRVLEEQREQLMALNQSKDEFISLASHQLRTPATIVKQYVGMLLEGYRGEVNDEMREFLKVAYESNERELEIISDLLKVARVDAGKVVLNRAPADLVTLIGEVVKEQAATFQLCGQQLVFEHGQRHVKAVVDEPRMRMVLENLIDNASKYSGKGKTTTIRLQSDHGRAIISISDQGVGIAKKDIQKLFQKFSRVDNAMSMEAGGTGIGLYWAKKIVDLHGGSIDVESQLHKGSVFSVTLPKKWRSAALQGIQADAHSDE